MGNSEICLGCTNRLEQVEIKKVVVLSPVDLRQIIPQLSKIERGNGDL